MAVQILLQNWIQQKFVKDCPNKINFERFFFSNRESERET